MSALESLDLTAWHFKLPSRSKELGSRLFEVRFHRFPGAQIFVYKRLQINSCSKCFWRWRDSRNSEGVGCRTRGRTKTRLALINVVHNLRARNADWWNEVSAPDPCASTHATSLLCRKWQVDANQASRTENNHEFGNGNSWCEKIHPL